LSVREARVRNDSRNLGPRAVPRQFFGTFAKPHFASGGAVQRPELAQEVIASGMLEDELCSCRWVKCKYWVSVHDGYVLAIGALKPYDRLCMHGPVRDRVIARGKSLILNSEGERDRDSYEGAFSAWV